LGEKRLTAEPRKEAFGKLSKTLHMSWICLIFSGLPNREGGTLARNLQSDKHGKFGGCLPGFPVTRSDLFGIASAGGGILRFSLELSRSIFCYAAEHLRFVALKGQFY